MSRIILPPPSPECASQIAMGAIASISGIDFKDIKTEFNACTKLQEAANSIGSLEFTFDEGTPSEMIGNLKLVSTIFAKVLPAWKSCPQL